MFGTSSIASETLALTGRAVQRGFARQPQLEPFHGLLHPDVIQATGSAGIHSQRRGAKFLGSEAEAGLQVKTHVETFPLTRANTALDGLHQGQLQSAAVLTMD
jgi:D-arabinose 1-dehydrogenase-like Zn-dependent alcohol dehydrogenase